MNETPLSLEKRIFVSLKEKGCCLRCCLRFIGLRTPQCYEEPIIFVRKEGYIDADEKHTDNKTCITCLGILQDNVQQSVIDKVECEIAKENYDSKTFVCALTIPVSVKLRERSLHIYIIKELNLPTSELHSFRTKLLNIKDIWKWVVIPKIEKTISKRFDLAVSPFLIEIVLTYPSDEDECKVLLKKNEAQSYKSNQRKRKFNNKFSRKNIESLMTDMTDEQFAEYCIVPPIKPDNNVTVDNVICSHSSIYVGGRYNKFSRELSQTPWFINGEKKMETSVQDILCNPIAQAIKAQSIKFLSSGREDVDVRNIHSGRPFAVELINPRMTNITENLLSDLVAVINNSSEQVKVTSHLKVLSRLDLKRLKEGENVKSKFYRAVCVTRALSKELPQVENLNNMKNLKIVQKTPVRVLHRRPLSPRVRYIYEMRARWAKPYEVKNLLSTTEERPAFFVLDVKTQAGTYVKEFVHGDFGRTKPNLCELLNAEVDIIALDVTGININWP